MFLSQSADSLQVEGSFSVVAPQNVELKVKRPRRPMTYGFESEESNAGVEQPVDNSAQTSVNDENDFSQPEPAGSEADEDIFVSDSLTSGLKKDGQLNGLAPGFWQNFQENVTPLPADYFSGSGAKASSNTGRKATSKTSAIAGSSKSDGVHLDTASEQTSAKGMKTFEEIEISDPSLTTHQTFDHPLLQQDWFLVVVVALVGLTGLIRFRWPRYLSDVFSVVLFPNVANKLQATHYKGLRRAPSIWLGFLFYGTFSVFLFEGMYVNQNSLLGLEGWKLLMVVFVFVVVAFTARSWAYRFVGWVFRVGKPISEYLFHSYLMARAFGVMLVPLVGLFPFLQPELRVWVPKIGIGLFIVLYVLLIGRGIRLNLRSALSGYYIILYLCALEILPLSVLYYVLFH